MELSIIVAMTKQRVIGNNDQLPWHIPDDLKLFKEITMCNTVIMGRPTFFSIPEKFRPLKNRNNIVLTRGNMGYGGIAVCHNIQDSIKTAESYQKPCFVIGGAQIYEEFLPLVDRLLISEIKTDYAGNIYFPEIDFSQWNLENSKDYAEFVHKTYKRK